jgi:DnaJ-class molecular chaperone
MPRSNYAKHHVVRTEGVEQEQVCPSCKGLGEDPRVADADCLTCWGDGTIVISTEVT